MTEQTEREWTDEHGTHWEVRQRGPSGEIHSAVLTKHPHLGWPDRDPVRAQVARAALEQGENTFEVGKPAPYFCPACQAVPRAGYCKLKGCPTAPAALEQGP